MAIETPKHITAEAIKSYEPKKTVELKSPGGAVIGSATGSPRAIPASRPVDAQNQVNEKRKQADTRLTKVLAVTAEIVFGILSGPTGCTPAPASKPVLTPIPRPPLAEKTEKINLDEIPVANPILDKPGHSVYLAYEIKKDPSSVQRTAILIIRKKDENDPYPRLSVVHFPNSFDKVSNKDIYLNEEYIVKTGPKDMYDRPVDGQRVARIKTPANEVIDVYVGIDGMLYATLKKPTSSYAITSFGYSGASKDTSLLFDTRPNSSMIKTAKGKKYFVAMDKNYKIYTGILSMTRPKINIESEFPELKGNLGLIFENPDDDNLIFKSNAKEIIKSLDIPQDKKDLLIKYFDETMNNNRLKEVLYNYPSDKIN